jgi:di/tricarboxylate transporter
MLTLSGALVLAVIAFILITLYFNLLGAGFTFLIGVMVLAIFQIITPHELLAGLANEQIVIVIILLMISDIFRQTSILDIFFDRIFRGANSYPRFLTRLLLIIPAISAFLNNTPLVALMMPYIHNWSKKNKVAVSKLLIPLSYATISGGLITLIGTSTNLVVNSMVVEQKIIPGLKPLEMFDFTTIGLTMAVVTFLYLRFIGSRILPVRTDVLNEMTSNNRKYFVEVQIKSGSSVIGQKVSEIQVSQLKGLHIFELIHDNKIIAPVPPETVLWENDVLLLQGENHLVAELANGNDSLVIPSVGMYSRKKTTDVVEIVVSHNSSMLGRSLEKENFRARFDATVIAIHRNGERLSGKIGEILINPGDVLLVLAGSNFANLAVQTNDFVTISTIKEIRRLGFWKTLIMVGGFLLTIVLSLIGIIKFFNGLVVLLIAILFMKVVSPKEISKSIDYDLALIVTLSFSLGMAMMKTGVAEFLSLGLIHALTPFGNVGIIAGVYLITTILAAFINTKAAVAVIFPIALTTALKLNLPPIAFVLTVAFAGSANFMTPFGYQTNTMIYGSGNYKFSDYLKIGTPLTILYLLITISILYFKYL